MVEVPRLEPMYDEPQRMKEPAAARWWQWPTILSIDAPLIALLWFWLFSRDFDIEIHWVDPIVLSLGVHGVYVLDRALDARALGDKAVSIRHRFYARKPRHFLVYSILLLLFSAVLGIINSTTSVRYVALSLAATIGIYILFIHAPLTRYLGAWLKEVVVGTLFAMGVVLVPLLSLNTNIEGLSSPSWGSGIMVVSFVLLCISNTLSISWFERHMDAEQGTDSLSTIVHNKFQGMASSAMARGASIILVLVAFAVLLAGEAYGHFQISLCLALGFILYAFLHFVEGHFTSPQLRVMADIVLITPLILVGLVTLYA